jgi:hypothetical protein
MPAVQTSYATTMRVAFAGLKGDTAPEVILTRQVETAGGIGFGLAVTQGTGDRQVPRCRHRPQGFIGMTLVDQTAGSTAITPPTNVDQYQQGDIAAVMQAGSVWVLADGAVTAGAPATFTTATGRIGAKTVSTTGIVAMPNAYFETSAADGALALVRLR